MTQEEKELLLKDLCTRLPYGVVIHTYYNKPMDIKCTGCDLFTNTVNIDIQNDDEAKVYVQNIRPYLRPMSSMTEEELKQLAVLKFQDDEIWEISNLSVINNDFVNVKCKHKYQEDTEWTFQVNKRESLKSWQGIDWLNEHHFDYRGLIEKGLALEAKEGMYD